MRRSAQPPREADLRDDPEDPSRRLIRVMLGAVAEYERAMTALRMARGRRRARREGRSIGPAPYGWRKDPDDSGDLVPDESGPHDHVATAYRLREEQGWTLTDVAEHLAATTGRPWHPTQVTRAVERFKRYG